MISFEPGIESWTAAKFFNLAITDQISNYQTMSITCNMAMDPYL